jgi:membrane protein
VKAFAFVRKLVKECQDDDILGLAGEMAYWVVFSLFPFFIFLGALTGIIGWILGADDLLTNIMNNLYSWLDYSTAETLRKPLNEVLSPNRGTLSLSAAVSALVALNTASGAMGTAMKACNRAYGVRETRKFVRQKAMALGFTVLLTVSLIGGTLLLAIGGLLLRLLRLDAFAHTVLTWLRVISGLIGIMLGFALLYWKSPNLRQPFRWVFPGVAVSTLGLIALSFLFSAYVRLFAGENFNRTYGTIAGIVLFLFLVRLASIIVLVGAEINAEIAREQGVLMPIVRAQRVEADPANSASTNAPTLRGRFRALRKRRARRRSAGSGDLPS